MDLRVIDVINAKDILDKVANSSSLPTRTAYKIHIMLNKLNASLEFFEKRRMQLFEEYGEREGDQIIIPKDKIDEFRPKYDELCNLPLEEEIEKVDISLDVDLGISPNEIGTLESFINFIE